MVEQVERRLELPVEVAMPEMVDQVYKVVMKDRGAIIRHVAETLGIGFDSVQSIFTYTNWTWQRCQHGELPEC